MKEANVRLRAVEIASGLSHYGEIDQLLCLAGAITEFILVGPDWDAGVDEDFDDLDGYELMAAGERLRQEFRP